MKSLRTLMNRDYTIVHRRFSVRTSDGVRIAGIHLDRRDSETLILYVHGFLANKNYRRVPSFMQALAQHFDVMSIDLRGHGESGGTTTMGHHEVLDIEATIEYARRLGYQRIITLGSSMGGASVLRHAALHHSQEGVITIGAFADVSDISPSSNLGVSLLFGIPRWGNHWAYLTRGTRLGELTTHEPPWTVVGRISPVPLLLIHGGWDHVVLPRALDRLYESANEPKERLLIPRGGHDYAHQTQSTVDVICDWIERQGLDG